MLQTLARRSAAAATGAASASGAAAKPFNFETNRFKSRRQWPPDISKLSNKDQFRLERKYKRRAKLKFARPRWMMLTRFAQWGIGITVLFYGVFYQDWGDERAFAAARAWYRETLDAVFSQPTPPSARLASSARASKDTSAPGAG